MVATVRTWGHDLNYSLVGGTLLLQYQDFWFRAIQFYLAAGYSVTRSSDSAAAGAAGDGVNRIITSANIVPNSSGLAHSWIILQSPAGASRMWILLDFLDASPATPDQINIYMAGSDFATGGSITARPTSALETSAFAGAQCLSSTSVVPRRFHGWRSDVGDLVINGVTDGQGSPYWGLILAQLAEGESNLLQPWYGYAFNSTGNPGGAFAGTSSALFQASNWRTLHLGGAPVNASAGIVS